MLVIKRSGEKQKLNFSKIQDRVEFLRNPAYQTKDYIEIPGGELNIYIDGISKSLVNKLHNNIHTSELDIMGAIESYDLVLENPLYETLAVRFMVNNLHKFLRIKYNGELAFYKACKLMRNCKVRGNMAPKIKKEYLEYIEQNKYEIEEMFNYSADYNITYHGIKLMFDKYLTKINECEHNMENIIESPQHVFMRVAIQAYCHLPFEEVKDDIYRSYKYMSELKFTHATPTLFNSLRINNQLSSCYLTNLDDSTDHIIHWLGNTAKMSRYGGGVGSNVHNIRATNAYIKGTHGTSNGLTPILKINDQVVNCFDQGGGKRKGAHAIYVELWHPDIIEFIDSKLKRSVESKKLEYLFTGLWICDEFQRRAKYETMLYNEGIIEHTWYLISPDRCRELVNSYDHKFSENYLDDSEVNIIDYEFTYNYRKCINEGNYDKVISARELMLKIHSVCMEMSMPYKCMKDTANRLNNQSNQGMIYNSNLCTEIYEHVDNENIAVCNLASVCVNKFIEYDNTGTPYYDHEALGMAVRQITRNIDNIIDNSFCPVEEGRNSNQLMRPIGIGPQGLNDAFILMGYEFGSREALELDYHIFETMYYYSLLESIELAEKRGAYPMFRGSPLSMGKLQQDLTYNALSQVNKQDDFKFHDMYDWDYMRKMVKKGVRNSLRIACMPTASTSTIMGNSPCIEPYIGNIYKRSDSIGETIKYNKHLINELIEKGLWSSELKNMIMNDRKSSIQHLDLPEDIKKKYKVAFDKGMNKAIINHSIARNWFVDQGQSLNLFMENPTAELLNKTLYYAWSYQLKTASYYIRRLPKIDARKDTIISHTKKQIQKNEIDTNIDDIDNTDNKDNPDNPDINMEVQETECTMCMS